MTSKSAFKKELEIIHSDLIKINDWMYENPELAFEEFKTSEYLVNYLKNFSDSKESLIGQDYFFGTIITRT